MTSDRIICSRIVCPLALAASMTCGAAEPFRIAKDEMSEIVIQEGVRPFVAKAAEDVAGDLEKIFGVRAKVTAGGTGVSPVEGTEASATGRMRVLPAVQTRLEDGITPPPLPGQ